jgi:hypothetical protein
MNLLTSLLSLQNVIDAETKELFGRFCAAALVSGNPNEFVKSALRRALEPEPAQKPPMVDAEVVNVSPPRKHGRER